MAVLSIYVALHLSSTVLLDEPEELKSVVIQAFATAHDGYSSDEVILSEELNSRFVALCQAKLPETAVREFNWTLLNLRKAGKLKTIPTTRRVNSKTDDVIHVAEIASRSLIDRRQVSIDRMMTDPKLRTEFDQLARQFDEDIEIYLVRKAALQLRKVRRLKPELITRIADWGREITKFSIDELREDTDVVPEKPGIYIFYDDSGYIYIGQSDNLRKRLAGHIEESGNRGLAAYLSRIDSNTAQVEIHAFPIDSRARDVVVRRAYESELIRNRNPRFNVQP